jgi:hypothetical protein
MKKENKCNQQCNYMNQSHFKLSIFVALSATLFSFQSFGARGSVAVVKLNQRAAQGTCMPQVSGNSSITLSNNNIGAFSGATAQGRSFSGTNPRPLAATDARQQAVARVLQTMNSLGGGNFSLHRGAKFVFGSTAGQPSRQTADHIQLNPGNQNIRALGNHAGHSHGGTTNTALIAHELGHYVGNNGLYQPYFQFVRGGCNVSGYSGNRRNGRRNEEFAEVFSAYLTNPEMLSAKGGACQKALDFMKGAFGEQGNPTCESRRSLSGNSSRVASSARPRARSQSGLGGFITKLFSGGFSSSSNMTRRNCASVTGGRSVRGSTFCNARQEGQQRAAENANNGVDDSSNNGSIR